MLTMRSHIKNDETSSGFVLPYVILVIAILSITITILADRLQNITQNISVIENQFEVELALLNAESEATYAILTGKPLDLALDINPLTPQKTLIDLLADENKVQEQVIPPDPWSVIGGQRIANHTRYPVLATLQDVSGLIPLNIDNDLVEKLLVANGFSKNIAQSMSAKLNDYMDLDNKRQFLGAERSDYRLRKLPVPTNAMLRNFDELSNVMGWTEGFENVDLHNFMDMTTLYQGRSLSQAFVPAEFSSIVEKEQNIGVDDFGLDVIYQNTKEPSGAYRLSLLIQTEGRRYKKRVLEVSRQSTNVISPFKSILIYERSLDSTDVDFDTSNIKNVISAIPETQ